MSRILMKPICFDEFAEAPDKTARIIEDEFIVFSAQKGRIVRLRKRDVIFAETDNKAVKVYTRLGIYEAKINIKK